MSTRQVLFERDGDALVPTDRALGPWSDGRLHGGAVAGLLAELVARVTSDDQMVASFRVDLFGPVPSEPLLAESVCVRNGDRLAIWDASLRSAGRTRARATAILSAPPDAGPDAVAALGLPGPDCGTAPSRLVTESSPFFEGIEFAEVRGAIGRAGPTAVWTNVGHWWSDEGPPSALTRLVAAADTVYGYGSPVEGPEWFSMNLDLTVHLLREPRGEWLLLDAETDLSSSGLGVGHARIGDLEGRVGTVSQSVYVRRSGRDDPLHDQLPGRADPLASDP